MVALYEYCEKYGWWLNELLSLGLAVNRRNEFNDIKEISGLADNLKRYYHTDSRNSSYCSD
ncbi:MAG TPA: hypothetical protein VE130_09175 [Nitrososphaeraceae archaeon]|nr:hypothetical protein [Nitrososphaeraceae archaeon]